jgi:hypothetical protein
VRLVILDKKEIRVRQELMAQQEPKVLRVKLAQLAYKENIFTCGLVGWPDVPHISDRNFSPVIERALATGSIASIEVRLADCRVSFETRVAHLAPSGSKGVLRLERPSALVRVQKRETVRVQVPEGTPVYVTANGVVTYSGQQGDYGNIIVVEHDSRTATAYAHLKKRRVDQGDAVQQGQHIGDVGRTGNATANHLHYEVRIEGQPVDPMGYLPR